MIHDSYLWKKEGVPQPLSCTIDLTEACNLACSYCFTYSKHVPKKLDEKLGKRLVEWFICQASVGVTKTSESIQVTFWGGEPLLEWKLLQRLVYFANDFAASCGIPEEKMIYGGTTNGVLYTPEKVEWCKNNNALMLLSYDGIKPAHDMYRKFPNGAGSWKIVDRNLRSAVEVAPNQRTRMSFSPETLPYFLESIQYLHEEIGVHHMAFSPVYEANWDEKAIEYGRKVLMETVEYAIKQAKQGTPIILKHLNDEASIGRLKSPENPCGAGRQYFGFSVDGFGFPCHRFNKHGLSTEERAKLPSIISQPDGNTFKYCNKEFRKIFYEFKDNPPSKCQECEYFNTVSCKGGCYATNYDLTGSIRKQAPALCAYNKMQHDVGQHYAERVKEEGIIVPSSQGESVKRNQTGCICYNMCYQEGTDTERFSVDRRNDRSCLCYQTAYDGDENMQHRPICEVEAEAKLLRKHLRLCRNILATRDEEKTKEVRQLEAQVVEQMLHLLGRSKGL